MTSAFDPANKNAIMEQIDSELNFLVLVTGRLADGSEHFAYASIPPSRYLAFKEAEAKGNYDLGKFGKILHHGAGKEPSAETKKEMEDKFGVNHQFEEELANINMQLNNALKSGNSGN